MKQHEVTLYNDPRVILRSDNPKIAVIEFKLGWVAPSYTKELSKEDLVRIGNGFLEMAERLG